MDDLEEKIEGFKGNMEGLKEGLMKLMMRTKGM